MPPESVPRVYTIAEAAAVTGLSPKAIRSRCDRGQLRTVKRGGVRLIPLSELQRAGLLEQAVAAAELVGELDGAGHPVELVNRELLAELGAAHERIGELRALEQASSALLQSERRRLEAELALERGRRRDAEVELERRRLELVELQRQAARSLWPFRRRSSTDTSS